MGALLGSHPFTLAARNTLVLNTATVPGAGGQGGTLTIASDGRYGDLAGKTVALEPATGFSFDSPMSPRPRCSAPSMTSSSVPMPPGNAANASESCAMRSLRWCMDSTGMSSVRR